MKTIQLHNHIIVMVYMSMFVIIDEVMDASIWCSVESMSLELDN
jgi:hypothetical protein